MGSQRRFPRYDVTEYQNLRGYISEQGSMERLVSIGLGGCGFFGENDPSMGKLRQGESITCTFEMDGILARPLRIPGNVAYAYANQAKEGNIVFCGVEFDEEFRERIRPVIEQIEKEGVRGSDTIQME